MGKILNSCYENQYIILSIKFWIFFSLIILISITIPPSISSFTSQTFCPRLHLSLVTTPFSSSSAITIYVVEATFGAMIDFRGLIMFPNWLNGWGYNSNLYLFPLGFYGTWCVVLFRLFISLFHLKYSCRIPDTWTLLPHLTVLFLLPTVSFIDSKTILDIKNVTEVIKVLSSLLFLWAHFMCLNLAGNSCWTVETFRFFARDSKWHREYSYWGWHNSESITSGVVIVGGSPGKDGWDHLRETWSRIIWKSYHKSIEGLSWLTLK